jgi:hypothetical protein
MVSLMLQVYYNISLDNQHFIFQILHVLFDEKIDEVNFVKYSL